MSNQQKLFVCGISGETPEHPVVSPVSGAVFEKRLIEKWIQENGSDPVNDQPLDTDQLIEIKAESLVRPKAPNHTSIPALLKALQDEWDSVMLNSYSVRTNLTTTRQELSHALYQHDAACRVIARLQKETGAAREALATLKPSAAQIPSAQIEAEEVAETAQGLSEEIVAKLDAKNTQLTQSRKKLLSQRKEKLAGVDKLHNYSQTKNFADLHGKDQVLSVDISRQNNSRFVTGGANNMVIVYDRDTEKIVSSLSGHTKGVNKVLYHPADETCLSASSDNTVRVWPLGGASSNTIKAHNASVTDISLHATGDYVLSVSRDKSWAFSELKNGTVLTKAANSDQQTALCCGQFHPDGCLFGVGTAESSVKIWDIKSRLAVAQWDGHQGEVSSIAFSENGYYVATAAGGNEIKIWDLRKLKEIRSIKMREDDYAVNSLRFDLSGQYLAAAGQDIRLYMAKTWAEVTCYSSHEDDIMDVAFGDGASFLLSCSRDSTVKLYGDSDAQQPMES